MAKDTVEILIEGGSATPGPPLGPALGPFGINMMQVVEEINNKSADFAGMNLLNHFLFHLKNLKLKLVLLQLLLSLWKNSALKKLLMSQVQIL